MGITGDDKQQQCEACGTMEQKMKLRRAHGNLKLSLKMLTTLDNSIVSTAVVAVFCSVDPLFVEDLPVASSEVSK